ncbi:MAG: alkaline phosphatase family protein [Verrucomicrobia bacterium]|nr:alkaline phosphatase family protein [Verrucomicrobiota bacterium]
MTDARSRILVVALDGADFRLLRPWMDAGELPELACLAREGTQGPLRSVVPPLTPPAWASFATGKHPGRHGVFGFAHPDTDSDRLCPVSASDVQGATLWDYLRRFDVRSVVLGVPMTYPPTPVPGALVSCFMTPPGRRDFAQPREIIDEMEARFGPYPLYLDAPVFSANLSVGSVERFLRVLEHEAQYKFRAAEWLAERFDARLVMLHIWGTDRIQHELWNLLDETHPRSKHRLAARVREPILGYFRRLDARIGALRRALGGDTTTLVVSDHGFGPVTHVIDLNWWLAREGFIHFKRRPVTWLRRLTWRCGLTASALTTLRVLVNHLRRTPGENEAPAELVRKAQSSSRRVVLSFRDVDWPRTTAYSPPGLSIGAIRINVRGRETSGCVEPGAEYEAVRARVVERLGALVARRGIGPGADSIHTGEELYGSDGTSAAPDVLFLPLEAGYLPTNLFDFIGNRVVQPARIWPGNHRMDGVLIAHGPHVRAGHVARGARIVDVAPTLLHLLGCAVPTDMDGRPLLDMLDGAASEVGTCEPAAPYFAAADGLTQTERNEMIDRLRSLGYI